MTTGSKVSGDSVTSKSGKTWSGSNGKYNPSGLIKENPYTMYAYWWRRSYTYKSRVAFQVWNYAVHPPVLGPVQYRCDPAPARGVSCDVVIASPWTSNDELVLLGKLAEAVRGHQFNLGVFSATGKQTYSQTLSTLGNLGKSLIALKRGRISDSFKYLGLTPGQRELKRVKSLRDTDISGAWLAMQYGWLPTVSDIHEAWTAFAGRNEIRTKTYKVRHRVSKDYDGSVSPTLYSCANKFEESVILKYSLREELSTPRALGLTDPLTVAWELLPWSFVIDWFLPIGDYLEVLNVIPKLKGSYVRSSRQRMSGAFAYPKSIDYLSCGSGRWSGQHVWINRTVGTSLSVPLPTFVGLSDAMSPGRIKNAVALIHQKIR